MAAGDSNDLAIVNDAAMQCMFLPKAPPCMYTVVRQLPLVMFVWFCNGNVNVLLTLVFSTLAS